MSVNYSDLPKSTQTGLKGGFKPKLYFMVNDDVLTWVRPLAVSAGDTVSIATAHTMKTAKGIHTWDAKLYSVKATIDPVGDPGAQSLNAKLLVTINGHNAVFFEQIQKMLNDELTFFIKDADCITNGTYLQIGDDCNPAAVIPKFDSKDNSPTTGGQKEWTLEITSAVSFFYTAAALPVTGA